MKRILFFLFFILSCPLIQAINVKLLKGTHMIIDSDYSPVMGLSFLEWNLAEQFYQLSPKFQYKKLDEKSQNVSEPMNSDVTVSQFAQVMKALKNNATQDLVMQLYHIVGNSFQVTTAPDNPVYQLEPYHLGQILRIIHDEVKRLNNAEMMDREAFMILSKDEINKINQILNSFDLQNGQMYKAKQKLLNESKNLSNKTATLSGADLELHNQALKANNLALKKINSDFEELNLKVTRWRANLKIVENGISAVLSGQIGTASSIASNVIFKFYICNVILYKLLTLLELKYVFINSKGVVLKWDNFVKAIVGSLKESTGPNRVYTENTTQGLLLSYLLAKSNTRNDLQQYFSGFTENPDINLQLEEYTIDELDKILQENITVNDFKQFADLVCAYTYKEKFASSFPKIENYGNVRYEGVLFADCVETVFRMLTNIVTYQQSLGRVGVVPLGLQLNENITRFYASLDGLCAQAAETGNQKVYQAWSEVISNVPNCIYKKIVRNEKSYECTYAQIENRSCMGVIPIDKEIALVDGDENTVIIDGVKYDKYILEFDGETFILARITINNQIYLLIPKNVNLFCCELMSYYWNIMAALNYIFQIGLDQSINQVFKSGITPNFISDNFEKICKKLNWEIEPNSNIQCLNSLYNGYFFIKIGNRKVSIGVLYGRHVDVNVEKKSKLIIDNSVVVDDHTPESFVALVLAMGLKKVEELPLGLQKPYLYKNIPVLDNNESLDVINEILLQKEILRLDQLNMEYIEFLIKSFCLAQNSFVLEQLVKSYGFKLHTHNLGNFILDTLKVYDYLYKTHLINTHLVSLFADKIIDMQQLLENLKNRLNIPNNLFEPSVSIVILELIEQKLITENDLVIIWTELEKSCQDSNPRIQDFVLKTINDLLSANLIMKSNVTQILFCFKQCLGDAGSSLNYNVINYLNIIKDLVSKKLVVLNNEVLILSMFKGLLENSTTNTITARVHIKVMAIIQILMSQKEEGASGEVPDWLTTLLIDNIQKLNKSFSDEHQSVSLATLSILKELIYKKLLLPEQINQILLIFVNYINSDEDESSSRDFTIKIKSLILNIIKDLISNRLISPDNEHLLWSTLESFVQKETRGFKLDILAVISELISQKITETSDSIPNWLWPWLVHDMQQVSTFSTIFSVSDKVFKIIEDLLSKKVIKISAVLMVFTHCIQESNNVAIKSKELTKNSRVKKDSMPVGNFVFRNDIIDAVGKMIEDGSIASDNVLLLLPLLKQGSIDVSFNVKKNIVAVIKQLIVKDLLSIEQISSLVVPLLEEIALTSYAVRFSLISVINLLVQKKIPNIVLLVKVTLDLFKQDVGNPLLTVSAEQVSDLNTLINNDLVPVHYVDLLQLWIVAGLNSSQALTLSTMSTLVDKKLISLKDFEIIQSRIKRPSDTLLQLLSALKEKVLAYSKVGG